jgi:putative hydrolase of the HAD superfamily
MPVDPSRPAVAALLLDVDDTLIDTRAAMVAAAEATIAQLWPGVGPEMLHAAGVQFHSDPGGFFARFTTGELTFRQMRHARVADLIESLALVAADEDFLRFDEVYDPAFSSGVRLFDDVVPLVEAAGEAGIRMGLLTNSSSSYTEQKLEITGLTGVFAVVATRDTLGYGKPDSRAFHHACRLLGVSPAETLYVGDHLEIDAIAAREAGLSAVWLRRDAGESRGMARARERGMPVVSSLRQIPELLTGS